LRKASRDRRASLERDKQDAQRPIDDHRAMRRPGRALLLFLSAACAKSAPPPPPAPIDAYGPPPGPGGCFDGPPVCSFDRRSVVQCQRGAWVMLQPCPGPRGCAIGGNAIQCDPGMPHAGGASAPCAAEGGYGCTPDGRALTQCRAGRTVIVSTCRGARGCVVGEAVDCDTSVALVGDRCDGPKEIACSTDNRSLLRCVNGVFQVGEPCRSSCLATKGRVLCQ
jgi:hypothetical protein